MEISVHNLDQKIYISKQNIIQLIHFIAKKLELDMASCLIIFVKDEKLRLMHQEYLNDPDFTDVMTFNLGDDKIEGEIYISQDRIAENAKSFNVSIQSEINRTIIHGLLHLKGYDDKNDIDKTKMKDKEEELLSEARNLYNS
jgi:rRNA maturation RNase YbeY